MPVSRRGLLAGTAVAGAALAIPGTASAAGAITTTSAKIGPGDARYQDLVLRGQNRRFVAKPDYARVIQSSEDAVAAVQDAVRSGKRIAVRGGGHCFEDFVDSSDIEVLLDMSTYDAVTWDPQYRAFSIGAGRDPRDRLQGTVLRVGPHGARRRVPRRRRRRPLRRGRIRAAVPQVRLGRRSPVRRGDRGRRRPRTGASVVATRDNEHSDLWWAHTGGGGGNFGVITRYLMRTNGSSGRTPAESLPKAPAALRSSVLLYDWKTTTQAGFLRTVRNWFDFFEQHNTADSPYATLYAPFILTHSSAGNSCSPPRSTRPRRTRPS